MNRKEYTKAIAALQYGKRLPTALYVFRPKEGEFPSALAETIRRADIAASPEFRWNVLKLHTDQFALTFLSYPDFDTDPHPILTEATKINLESGTVVHTDYRSRANPPILHRKETFLSGDDPRVPIFSELTRQEEGAGLFRDTSRIGLRIQWLTLLRRKGLVYAGHTLLPAASTPGTSILPANVPAVERHRTAIKRYDLSRPVKMLLERGLFQKKETLFDYGCGHGMDIEALSGLGYNVSGWDPAFRPDAPKRKADVVNLGYVLNVIEDPSERLMALREAYGLADRLLFVSTLVTGQETDSHARSYRDGFLTKTNTFQKFYAPGELETLIEETLDAEVTTLALGVCAVFRNPEEAELFEASRSRRRIDWSEISSHLKFSMPTSRERRRVGRYELHKELFDEFWRAILDFGRLPEPGEFDRLAEVRKASGGLKRALGLVLAQNGKELWEIARRARTEDVLVYLAMTNFRKQFLRREIPLRIKNDIRDFFGDVTTAKAKARDLLFATGDTGEVALALEGLDYGVYSQEEHQFTFHRRHLHRLPAILRVYVQCAAVRFGNPEDADLIKIHVRSGKLTFLHYRDFETDATPVLLTRIKVNLRTQFVQVFDHSEEKQGLENKAQFLRKTASERR